MPTNNGFLSQASTAARYLLARRHSELSLADQVAFAPFLVQLVVTRRCNLACGYCNEFDRTSDPVPTGVLEARIGKIRSLGALSIEFTGGEALLHPDLARLVARATALDFPARMLISNALLMTDDRIRALNDAGLTHLQVSVDGVADNDITKKTLSSLRRRLDRVSELAAFKVVMSGVVGTCPPEETLEMIDFARDRGFIPRVLLVHGPDGQLKLGAEELRTYGEAKRRIGRRFAESHGYREKLIAGRPAPFKCRAGARYIYVDEHGDAHWCSQKRGVFRKPILDYTLDTLKAQFHARKGCEDFCTVGCARTNSALDERRGQGR